MLGTLGKEQVAACIWERSRRFCGSSTKPRPRSSMWTSWASRSIGSIGSPGMHERIETAGLDEFQQQLLAKKYKNARPGIEDTPWGTREMMIADPFGHRPTFAMASAK